MKKRKPRAGLSPGTLAMLLLTAAVILGCVAFLGIISGEAMSSRAKDMMVLAERAGVALISEEESREITQAQRRSIVQPTAQAAQIQETSTPQGQSVLSFTLAAAGTVCAPKAIRSGALNAAGEYDFSGVFEGLGDALSKADLAIATLETLTAGDSKGYGNYNAPAALLDAMRGAGIDLVSLGTERALDKGYEGLDITTRELTARGMAHAGVSPGNEEAGLIGSINGVDVAVLAYTYGLSEEGKAAASENEQSLVSILDMEQATQDIRRARANGADVVIVLPHWGTKNKLETPEEVRRMAGKLAQAGADVILGTHPNVVQGTERLRVTRADGLEYETVVCYSLGSLLCDARTEENTAGMVAQLQITYDRQTRRASLGSLACVPVYIAREKKDGQNVFSVIDVENTQALDALGSAEREEALRAAKRVREITGQSDMEDEGEG